MFTVAGTQQAGTRRPRAHEQGNNLICALNFRKNLEGELLTQFYAPLVIGVDVPYAPLPHKRHKNQPLASGTRLSMAHEHGHMQTAGQMEWK